MPDELLLHPRTKIQVERFTARQGHAAILTGATGSGKQTLAREIAAKILGIELQKLLLYAYFTELNPDSVTITIEEVRSLQKLLNLKTPGVSGTIRRVIVIINAERMTNEAQNAFLKSLEEPPVDTCIIMTAEGNQSLLPTIYSRANRIEVLPVSEEAARIYFAAPSMKLAKSYALSQGQVGLLSALLSEKEHVLKEWVEKAKAILAQTSAERLAQTEVLAKDKQNIRLLLNALQSIAHAGLMSSSKAGKTAQTKHWHSVMSRIQFASGAMTHNANTKLLLDDLFLNI